MNDADDIKNKKVSKYNKTNYELNKEKILRYRRERYKILHTKVNDIRIETGYFILNFD